MNWRHSLKFASPPILLEASSIKARSTAPLKKRETVSLSFIFLLLCFGDSIQSLIPCMHQIPHDVLWTRWSLRAGMLNTIIAIPFFLHDPYSTATSTTKITTVKASGSFHVIVSLSTKNRSFKFSHSSITEIELVLLTNTSDGFTIKLNFNFFFF